MAINHSGVLEMIKSPYSETLKFDLPGREHFGRRGVEAHFDLGLEAEEGRGLGLEDFCWEFEVIFLAEGMF